MNDMLKITMQQIAYFLTLCDTLNFTKTAGVYYLSQPTLSRQISMLEEKVGFQLFVRNHRNVTLTREGKILRTEWEKLSKDYEKTAEHIKRIASKETGQVKIGCLEYLSLRDITGWDLELTGRLYPNVEICVESGNYQRLRDRFLSDELDFLLFPDYEIRNREDLKMKIVADSNLAVIVSKKSPLFEREELDIDLLRKEKLLLLPESESLGYARRADRYQEELQYFPEKTEFISQFSSLLFALKCGTGVTICSEDIVFYGDGLLKAFPICNKKENTALLWKENSKNIFVREFTDTWR